MKVEHKLQALIDQWKEINGFINKLDTELWVVFTILASVYGVVITAFKGNLCPRQIADAKFWMLILLPIVSAAIIGCMANNFRWVAIARMYASALEREINDLLGQELYTWNLHVIDNYVEKNNVHNALIMPAIIVLFFSVLAVYLSLSMWSSPFAPICKLAYTIAVLALFAGSMVSLKDNGKVRKIVLAGDCFGKELEQAKEQQVKIR